MPDKIASSHAVGQIEVALELMISLQEQLAVSPDTDRGGVSIVGVILKTKHQLAVLLAHSNRFG